MRPSSLNLLFCQIESLKGVGSKIAKRYQTLCGTYVVDLLHHLPSGVNHRPIIKDFNVVRTGDLGTLCIEIDEHIVPANRRQPYRVIGHCGTQNVELVFFNYHKDYLVSSLPVGETRWISGKLEKSFGLIKLLHPDYMARSIDIIPEYETVYPLTAGLTSKMISKTIGSVLKMLPDLPEWLDAEFVKKQGWPSWKQAMIEAHHPKSSEDLSPFSPARARLAYDELLANQLALLLVRTKMKRKKGFSVQGNGELSHKLLDMLPFELTGAQKRVIQEIKIDAGEPYKMLRLVQGDVGSGKTIVALLAMLNAIECGHQAVFMAPTDILARQHFATLSKYCDPLGVRVEILSGREKGKKRTQILTDLQAGHIQILVGTHAVFVEDVQYQTLGLVVIDEQHKFGVGQRLALTQKQPGVDLLVMTATPIPRTLALTNYGDMDMSKLDEKPAGRKPIETRVLPTKKMDELIQKIHHLSVAENRQIYWVCPLVEESEKSDLTAAIERYDVLRQTFGDKVGLVHGKMKSAEKDEVMDRFASGELSVLVSTTVIEVGVDVPNATVMVIEHAERFGLSQLHQLRGRIGRGSADSTCLLVYGTQLSETAKKRLQVMRESADGFVIAEEDLKLRGAGEVLGTLQSGFMQFQMADLAEHSDILWTATKDAKMILNTDSALNTDRGTALKTVLYLFKKDMEINTLKSG
ncbi:MAG: ATP-dependent DNA helicase RecG [Alphaproteobacteria bacterium]|nr:ATP-dependent DNA helicase RecG [Alphaproteobacteria bacterium]